MKNSLIKNKVIRFIKFYIAEIGMFLAMVLLITLTVIAYSGTSHKSEEISKDYEIIRNKQDYADVETHEIETHKAAEEETTKEVLYYQVALDTVLQDYIFNLCDEAHINPALVIAIIERESSYCTTAKGDGGASLGLMQINTNWQTGRTNELGITNLFDPIQNVTVGIDILSELTTKSEDLCWILQAYNGGVEYANNNFRNQKHNTDYTNYVIERMQELDAERR